MAFRLTFLAECLIGYPLQRGTWPLRPLIVASQPARRHEQLVPIPIYSLLHPFHVKFCSFIVFNDCVCVPDTRPNRTRHNSFVLSLKSRSALALYTYSTWYPRWYPTQFKRNLYKLFVGVLSRERSHHGVAFPLNPCSLCSMVGARSDLFL